MLTILFSFSMAGIARLEKRRDWLWGLITFTVSAVIQTFLIAGYWGAVSGFFVCFGAMWIANIKAPVNKGLW